MTTSIKIAIIGTGLLGASLGMALRNAPEQTSPLGTVQVVGYDSDRKALTAARGRLAIDREAKSLADAVAGAQLVVLAAPVLAVRELLAQLGPMLGPGVVVTDLCSTKAQVMAWARELLPRTVDFIGGHPMAGSERSGPDAADPELLHEALYCLCVPPDARREAVEAVEALVAAVGAKPYYVDPEEHDSYVAGVSHLPFVLSAALVEAVSRSGAWREMQLLAATGFRDVTRLASGSPTMHRDICLTNRAALSHWLTQMAEQLLQVRDQLDSGDAQAVEELFTHARTEREAWLQLKPNLRPGEEAYLGQHIPVERPSLFGRLPRRDRK